MLVSLFLILLIQIAVDMGDMRTDQGYGDSNVLVLPTEKTKTRIRQENVKKIKKLTKKERKRLEKVVEQKEKKEKVNF